MQNVALFEDSARSFIDLISRVKPGQWNDHGLGSWSVRSLTGHTTRAITTVSDYLAGEAPATVNCADAETYVLENTGGSLSEREDANAAIAQRGVDAGSLLADSPLDQLTQQLERALAMIVAQPPTRVVSVYGGRNIPLSEHLRTRNFELVVHTMDLARATGIPHSLPARSVEDAVILAARVAVRKGFGQELLLAMAGRCPLPEGFNVV